MCGKGAIFLVILAGIYISFGSCQNAEPGRRRFDQYYENHREDFWNVPPEGPRTMRLHEEERLPPPSPVKEATPPPPQVNGNENSTLFSQIRRESFGLQSQRSTEADAEAMKLREARADRRRSRIERRKQYRRERRRRLRKEQKERGDRNRRLRNREPDANVRRWNRERANRIETRRRDPKWRDNLMTRLVKMLNKHTSLNPDPLTENSLNLSLANFGEDGGAVRAFEIANATSAPNYPIQLTTEPRIPEPPEPTSRIYVLPGDAEREFSRQMEREFSRAQLAEKTATKQIEEDDDEDEREEEEEDDEDERVNEVEEDFPRFDERYPPIMKHSEEMVKAPFDPERMLGYSRTDEDLPILDLEKEVLQRTIKDYNAYMSSSMAKSAKSDRIKEDSNVAHLISGAKESSLSSSTKSVDSLTDEDDPRGDLSCINGTFVPAPSVHHAVIKYLKSSGPGHEYLEADYKCERGFAMPNNESGARLLCNNRQWIGRLPVCRFSGDDESTCTELRCDQLCRIVEGRATCLCHEGFRIEGRRCIDIDECQMNEGHGPCEDTCRNYPGGFTCSCENRPGSILAQDNRTCREADPPGAGPCSYENAGCSHTCLASMGRVFCLCPDGFMLEDDWKTCQDVDECAVPDLQTEICHYGCVNTPGSYWCQLPQRSPDAQEVVPKRSGECLIGYEVTTTKNCVDINECNTNNGGCTEVCENTEGSYFCACEGDERILSPDKRSCMEAERQFESLEREATLSMRFHEIGDVSCSPLNPSGRGYLICSDNQVTSTAPIEASTRHKSDDLEEEEDEEDADEDEDEEEEERKPIRPGTKCHLKCPQGYELHGEYELTCRADGTWDGPKHGECLRYSKPRLDCPKDITTELSPGRDEVFVTYDQPSTDLDWFRYVRSKPSWGTRLEANLKKGIHEITFYARHPVSKKQTTCTLKINIEEGQAPKVSGCPSDIEITGKNGSAIMWIEPIFTDNINVTRVTNNESPGQVFSFGGHKVEYEASDEAGWTTKCTFTVVLRPTSE